MHTCQPKSRQVIQHADKSGKVIGTYTSQKAAEEQTLYTRNEISRILGGHKPSTADGHTFRYVDSKLQRGRLIEYLDGSGKVLGTYDTQNATERATKYKRWEISQILGGHKPCTAEGHSFRYVESKEGDGAAAVAETAAAAAAPCEACAAPRLRHTCRASNRGQGRTGNSELRNIMDFLGPGEWGCVDEWANLFTVYRLVSHDDSHSFFSPFRQV